MKAEFMKLTTTPLLLATLLLASCGKKNVVNTNPNTSFFSGSNTQVASNYSNLRNSMPCLSGRSRLNTDYTFSMMAGSSTQSTIYGQFQAGPITSGSVSEMYVGISRFNDLMFMTKITNGSGAVIGYNVTLSMCSMPNGNYPALISNERTLTNFQSSYITVNTNTNCGYGLIARADTYMVSNRIPSNPYTYDFPVYTTFSNYGGCIKPNN